MNSNYNDHKGEDPLYEQVMGANDPRSQSARSATMGAGSFTKNNLRHAVEGGRIISRSMYNLIMGLIILWGVGLDTFIVYNFGDQLTMAFARSWSTLIIFIGLVIVGTIIVNVSKNAILSFIGYNMLVVGFGISLAMIVNLYAPAVVLEAFLVTTIVTAFMLLMGTLWADFFLKIGRVLLVALIGVIIVEVIMLFITGTYPTWISVVSAIIFSGFIGYDWAMAQKAPTTTKNAVMFATALYVDIINLFLDLLRIFGDR